ncbi:Uncharacterized protein family UPF0121 [Amanita muscaria]
MATTQHYFWAGGHLLLLASAFRYFLAAFTFRSASDTWYKASLLGALISYAIVCYKSLKPFQVSVAWLKRALLEENVQYFVMAFFWWSSKPVTLALLPYAIFSLFHWLTFTRTTLLPQILPSGPPVNGSGAPQPHPIAKKLQSWVKDNYDGAMRIAAYVELLILLRVVLGLLFLQNSFMAPIIYAHFLRQRYYNSAFTREAVANTTYHIEVYLGKPGTPPVLLKVWDGGKRLVSKWGGTILVANQEGPAAGRR